MGPEFVSLCFYFLSRCVFQSQGRVTLIPSLIVVNKIDEEVGSLADSSGRLVKQNATAE